MFQLTEDQINYIIEVYGGTKTIINDIERRLNLSGKVKDEEDYYELVATVAAQKETIKNQTRGCTTRTEAMRVWVSTEDLIAYALKEKYNDFDENYEVQQNTKKYR